MSAECGRSRRTKRGSCFRAANRERQPSKKRTHTTRHEYASPKPRKSLSEATVTILAVQFNINLLHHAANLLSVLLSDTSLLPNSNIQLLRNTTFSRFHGIVIDYHMYLNIAQPLLPTSNRSEHMSKGNNNHDQKLQTRPTGCPRVMPRKWYDEYFAWPNTCTRMARNACYSTAIENGDLSFGISSFEPCVFCYKIRKKGG